MTCAYCGTACWTAKAAAGVIRSTQSAAPAGRTETTPSRYGRTITTMTTVTAAALRRRMVPTARARTAATATSAAVPTTMRSSVSHGTGNTYTRPRASWVPRITAAAAATSAAAKATEPITMALAASTRPRRGLAVSVVRIRPRRYSAVMNIVATTITTISPANVPTRKTVTVRSSPPACPGHGRGDVAGPGHGEPAVGLVVPADPRPVGGSDIVPGPGAAGHVPDRLTWSKTAVSWLGAMVPFSPPPRLRVIAWYAGEAANSPAWTVGGSPASATVPTWVQCVPSAES